MSCNRLALLTVALALLPGCGGCGGEKAEMNRESQRLWGTEKLDQEAATKAKESIDANALDENPEQKSHVLNMRFEEVIARIGFVEYSGQARFLLKRNGHTIDVPENTLLRHGLHGSFQMRQVDPDGLVAREIIYNNGVLYGQNGAKGKMRVLGMITGEPARIRDEAWQPLRVFASYYGPRFGMRKIGSANVAGRSAANYELVLLDGSPLVEVPGMKGAKKPISLKGNLYVDDATGAPIKVNLKGRLEIPAEKEGNPGDLELTLTSEIKTIEGEEIKPKEFVPEIKRREVDLEPLAFLEGETRTSTVIGGHQGAKAAPAAKAAPPAAKAAPPPPPAVKEQTAPPPPPATKKKAAVKKKKKRK